MAISDYGGIKTQKKIIATKTKFAYFTSIKTYLTLFFLVFYPFQWNQIYHLFWYVLFYFSTCTKHSL